MLLVLALVVVRGAVEQILIDADRSLATSDLVPFVADITAHPDEKVDDPGTGVLIFVRDPTGEVQIDSLPDDAQKAVERREPATETFVLRDDEERSFVVAGDAVSTPAGTWTVWSARSTAATELALRGLGGVLLIAGIVLLAGFAVASWMLATAALKPVSAMRRTAEAFNADSEATLPVGPARDELSALAQTLNDFLAQTRAATDREKQMVSDAAHELRTPLAALTTQLELAHADFGNAAALAAQVTSAEASVSRLTSLASNLLELSRLETESSETATPAGALVDEFTGSIDRARLLGMAKSARVEFAVTVADESVEYGVGAQTFGRLIDNLLTNALAAIPDDGEVVATIHQEPQQLRLDVRDSGPGMPEDFIPIAFDRFSRPDRSRTESTGGSGLGLALVQAIAAAAHGSAAVENTETGLRVTVILPKM